MTDPIRLPVARTHTSAGYTPRALECLCDIRAASEGDEVAVLVSARVDNGLAYIQKTEIGRMHRKRVLPQTLDTIEDTERRVRAGYAGFLVGEDRLVSRLLIWAAREIPHIRDGGVLLTAWLVPDGAVLFAATPEMSIHDAPDRDQQAYYRETIRVVLEPDLSQHRRAPALARLERLASDVVTFGTVRRHMSLGSQHDHPLHPVRLLAG